MILFDVSWILLFPPLVTGPLAWCRLLFGKPPKEDRLWLMFFGVLSPLVVTVCVSWTLFERPVRDYLWENGMLP